MERGNVPLIRAGGFNRLFHRGDGAQYLIYEGLSPLFQSITASHILVLADRELSRLRLDFAPSTYVLKTSF